MLVEVVTGFELADAVYTYPHAVMDERLPDGTPLGVGWALQHPQIYDRLYTEYSLLHDYFGRGRNNVMKRLNAIKKNAATKGSEGNGKI